MFTVLILACSIDFKDCKAFTSRKVFLEKSACLDDVALGISSIEREGWVVMDWVCYPWELPT